MVVEIINIKKCLVISAEITNVVVANGRNYTTTQDILVSSSKQFGRSLVALLPRVVVTVCQNKEAAPSFYTHTLTKFLTYKWQTVSKICSRRKVRRVQTYSLRNRLNLSLTSQTGRSQSAYAKFKTLCTFVSANVAISNKIRYILNRITAGFLRHYRTCCDIARLPKHKEPRFFCVHTLTNFCFSQWQTWTKVVFQRKALILLLSLYNRLNLSLTSQTGRSQSAYNHSLWTILKSSPRCSVSFS